MVGIPVAAGIPTGPEHKRTSRSVTVLAAIREICNADPAKAERVQARVREESERLIARDYAAVGFAFDEEQGSYIVEPYEDRVDHTP